jgi:4-hydroxybenzoate polyprenyltransferase
MSIQTQINNSFPILRSPLAPGIRPGPPGPGASAVPAAGPPSWRHPLSRAWFELYLSWHFVFRDLPASWYPSMLFTTAAWRHVEGSALDLTVSLLKSAVLFWFYIYVFCVSNQARGVTEDRLNKPHRPLVTGLISVPGAYRRFWVGMAVYTVLGWLFGVLEWVALWQSVVLLHNFAGIAKRWYSKNLAIGVGGIVMLAAAWQIVAPIGAVGWRWILVVISTFIAAISLQDLRDIAGDRATGRRTLPLVIGVWPTRILVSAAMAVLPVLTHFLLFVPASPSPAVLLVCGVALAGMSWLTAVRCIVLRSPQDDHRTYMTYTYTFCVALLSAVVVL